MKNRLAFIFGFFAIASVLSLCKGVEWDGVAPRQMAESGKVAGGTLSAPKQIADGQETHGFKPKNA